MDRKRGIRLLAAATAAGAVVLGGMSPGAAAPPGGGSGGSDTGSLYSDLVLALRDVDGTPKLAEYVVTGEEGTSVEYCVQPVSYTEVAGVTPQTNPVDGRQVWVLPLQGEWLENPVDPLPVDEIEPCDVQPQYAMFILEAELERLNLVRTSDDVLAKKLADVKTKLTLADEVGLDPAGRLTVDGVALDASPEYAAIYKSLMTTGGVPALDFGDIAYNNWQLAAVAMGTAASKGVPLSVDAVQYYNRAVGFTTMDPLPSWDGLSFLQSADPDPSTPMPVDVLPGSENFVDYGNFEYNRGDIFVGSVTWLDVPTMTWKVTRILEAVPWENIAPTDGLTADQVNHQTLTGVTAFAQMADDARAVIAFLHEYEVVLPGFYMDPVLVDTTEQQLDAITFPAVDLTAPTVAFQTLPFGATASVFNPWGGEQIDAARMRVTVDAPDALAAGDVTVSTADGALDLTADAGDLVGSWGPDTGFTADPGFRSTTDLTLAVADGASLGDYTITVAMVDLNAEDEVLAEDSVVVPLHASQTTVLWGGEVPALATQGSYLTLPVRVYAPEAGDATLTFELTGPGDDPATDLLEELAAGDAKVFASDGTDMIPMALTLSGQDVLTGTWPTPLVPGYNDLTWYLLVTDGAPVGQYAIDVGIQGATDLAETVYVTYAAPESHGKQPPDVGEDTSAAVITISLDALTTDSATFSFTANEGGVSFECQLAQDGVKGDWEACDSGTMTYENLVPAAYAFKVRGTDAADNVATYVKYFVIDPDTLFVKGPANGAFVLDGNVAFTLDSTADGAAYDVVVNGVEQPGCDTSPCVVSGLRTGKSTITFAAVTDVSADPTPLVRRVVVPRGVKQLNRSAAWTLRSDRDSLFGTFAVTRRSDQAVWGWASSIKRISLVVTKAPLSGKVHVYLGSRRLTDKPIRLSAVRTKNGVVIPVKTFAVPRTGKVRVVTVSSGKAVRIEGIGFAR
jgi:hypothetical protein